MLTFQNNDDNINKLTARTAVQTGGFRKNDRYSKTISSKCFRKKLLTNEFKDDIVNKLSSRTDRQQSRLKIYSRLCEAEAKVNRRFQSKSVICSNIDNWTVNKPWKIQLKHEKTSFFSIWDFKLSIFDWQTKTLKTVNLGANQDKPDNIWTGRVLRTHKL